MEARVKHHKWMIENLVGDVYFVLFFFTNKWELTRLNPASHWNFNDFGHITFSQWLLEHMPGTMRNRLAPGTLIIRLRVMFDQQT